MASSVGDVVLGRYYAADSVLHRMDPRAKIVIALAYMISAVLAVDLAGVCVLAVYAAVAIALSGIPVRDVFASIKPLLFILVFTALIDIFAMSSGTVYWHWGIITISSGGLWNALIFTLRITLMLLVASLLTLTTSMLGLTDGLEGLTSPLSRFGFPSHELAMMTAIALRFLPTFMDEGIKVKHAQESRGAEFDEGGPIHRLRMLVPLLAPLFSSAFRHAADLSQAMESRCYHGGAGRTRVRELKIGTSDIIAFAATCALIAALIAIRVWL